MPSIPRFLVPKTILSLVATLQFEAPTFKQFCLEGCLCFYCLAFKCCMICLEADAAKKAILPYVEWLRSFIRWKKPKWMALVLVFLVFRAYISFEAYLDEDSWCHAAMRALTIARFLVRQWRWSWSSHRWLVRRLGLI